MNQYMLHTVWLNFSCYIVGTYEGMEDNGTPQGVEVFFDDKETINKIRRLEIKQNEEMHKLLEEIVTSK